MLTLNNWFCSSLMVMPQKTERTLRSWISWHCTFCGIDIADHRQYGKLKEFCSRKKIFFNLLSMIYDVNVIKCGKSWIPLNVQCHEKGFCSWPTEWPCGRRVWLHCRILCGSPGLIPASIKSNTSCQWPVTVAALNCVPMALWSGDGSQTCNTQKEY